MINPFLYSRLHSNKLITSCRGLEITDTGHRLFCIQSIFISNSVLLIVQIPLSDYHDSGHFQ